jgi:hypothetical protein
VPPSLGIKIGMALTEAAFTVFINLYVTLAVLHILEKVKQNTQPI